MIKVMKFGGSSVGSERALRSLLSVIQGDQASKVLVVSAMTGVTNSLIGLMKEEQGASDAFFDELLWKHTAAVRPMMAEHALDDLEAKLKVRIAGLRQAVDRYQEPSARVMLHDTISSWGERLSSLMLASLLKANGVDALAMTSEEAGIVAIGTPGNGTADLKATTHNFKRSVRPLMDAGKTVVITGFYGTDPEGKPLTFGRGGSDYSGSVVGYALDADVVEIWTDVSGFMTADPRVVPTARTIREMDYGEAAELAFFGAKVLHPRTIEPARKKKILVKVKNTFDPSAEGTCIRDSKLNGESLLKSVAVKSDLAVVKVYSSEIVYNPSLVMHLLATVSENGSAAYAISTSLSTLAFAVPSSSAKGICERIRRSGEEVEKVTIKDNVSLVCAVGDDLINRIGASAKVFQEAAEAEANIEMISEGASDVALNFVVPSEKANEVVRRLHSKFIGA
ncbi:MAG: aspartate kinase [Methanomassiliicoccales archaeon]|nr:aspartate kinase [Methanomassiliicoccales archaeon]